MKTEPKHIFDFLLWPILKLIWEPFSLKRAHWWHWLTYAKEIPDHSYTVTVPGDKTAKRADRGWPNFYERNFGWQTTALLFVHDDKGQLAEDYHLGFRCGNKTETCSILLSHGIAALIGPDDTIFFAVGKDGQPLKVSLYLSTKKRNLKSGNLKTWKII
jgi:hypothetical protein